MSDDLEDVPTSPGWREGDDLIPPVHEQVPPEWLGGNDPVAFMAQPIGADSWLRQERHERLRHALVYASSKMQAIPALSKCTPEEAAMLFKIMLRDWERH